MTNPKDGRKSIFALPEIDWETTCLFVLKTVNALHSIEGFINEVIQISFRNKDDQRRIQRLEFMLQGLNGKNMYLVRKNTVRIAALYADLTKIAPSEIREIITGPVNS